MPVIAISADSRETGREIAQQTAGLLNYEFLDRDLLAELARKFSVPQKELEQALDQPPGLLAMRSRRREELLNMIQAACLEKLAADNVVCHGLAAHLYLEGVSHVLRIRILGDPRQRVTEAEQRAGIARERADKLLQRRDRDRRRWSLEYFGCDETDASLYDLILNLANLEPQKAVEIICDTAGYRKFQAMTYSRQCLTDKALASQVRLRLMPMFPAIRVESSSGTVVANLSTRTCGISKKKEDVRRLAGEVPGVNYVEVHVTNGFWAKSAQGRG